MSFNKQYGRILVGPVEISGLVDGLVYGLRQLGCEAEAVISKPHSFKYTSVPASGILKVWQKIGGIRIAVSRKLTFRKSFFVIAHIIWTWFVFLWALSRFNIFIFVFGCTITNTKFELWLLKRLNRKIIFVGVGSDTRPPYINGALLSNLNDDVLANSSFLKNAASRCKERLRFQEIYADYWINAPASSHFHEKPYINWSAIGVPKKIIVPSIGARSDSCPVRILHSPSNPAAKGTNLILEVVDRLRQKGYEIDLVIIQGLPNFRVLEELVNCDFVIDQVYSDAPMAGLAIEAAFFGKPTVVGGYFSSWLGKCVEAENLPPTRFVLPEDLEAAVEELIVDVKLRREIGEKAQDFVNNNWNPRAVAQKFIRLFSDDIPDSWWCDPRAICYLEGFGLSRERVKLMVLDLLRCEGVSALQLSDKPEFEDAFCKFVNYREQPKR